MEKWNPHHQNYNSPGVENHRSNSRREIGDQINPSFSSSLLDEIYRSIDDEQRQNHPHHEQQLVLYRETMRNKKNNNNKKKKQQHTCTNTAAFSNLLQEEEEEEEEEVHIPNIRRIDRKKVISSNVVDDQDVVLEHKKSSSCAAAATDENRRRQKKSSSLEFTHPWMLLKSSSAGGLIFSDGVISAKKSSSGNYSKHRPKPIRTSLLSRPEPAERHEEMYVSQQKHKHQGGRGGGGGGGSVVKSTKSKALKIYEDLKKVKQPISPGSRLASFLNSIFTTGNAKKAKVSTNRVGIGGGGGGCHGEEERKYYSKSSANANANANASSSSTCSSATSFSRSCLSKTTSSSSSSTSRANLSSNGTKRSVQFYPVSVIVDEDCQPCGHKSLQQQDHGRHNMNMAAATNSMNEELRDHIREKNRRVEEAARELFKKYQRKVECHMEEEEEEEEDDDASCASSDLFELDNLNCCHSGNNNTSSGVGLVERYREELPVYETTYFDSNRWSYC